jgi:hypothetical protein
MASERLAVKSAVDELNRKVLADRGFRLEVVSWETHGTPDFGTDAQAVLNRQLREWDIYIGILGHRFGTPTPRADSGTEEEFNAAYNRWRKDSRSCRLMFYFSDTPISPRQIDLEQVRKVQAFREKLGTLGSLYSYFRDATELPELLRGHLFQVVSDYRHTWGPVSDVPEAPMPSEEAIAPEEDVPTLLDLAADAEESGEALAKTLKRITLNIEKMGQDLEQCTSDVRTLGKSSSPSPRKARAIARKAAEAIHQMGTSVQDELPELRQSWSYLSESLFLMLRTGGGQTSEDNEALREVGNEIRKLYRNTNNSLSNIDDLRSTLNSLSALNRDLRRAAREGGSSLAALHTEISYITSQLKELEQAIRDKLDESPNA